MRFLPRIVPIVSSVSAFCPKLHANSFVSATRANSAYNFALSAWFSARLCPRWARNAFSYNG